MVDEWDEVAVVPLPESLSGLTDEEIEELRVFIEHECQSVFLRLLDGEC